MTLHVSDCTAQLFKRLIEHLFSLIKILIMLYLGPPLTSAIWSNEHTKIAKAKW